MPPLTGLKSIGDGFLQRCRAYGAAAVRAGRATKGNEEVRMQNAEVQKMSRIGAGQSGSKRVKPKMGEDGTLRLRNKPKLSA
jgi:hypothetical protein